jgi:hypothetical protein
MLTPDPQAPRVEAEFVGGPKDGERLVVNANSQGISWPNLRSEKTGPPTLSGSQRSMAAR